MNTPAQQTWRSHDYAKDAGFVSALGATVLTLLHPQPGEKILDLGCGDGTLALQIQEAGSAVVAVDASPSMIEATQAKGLDALVMSGEALTFREEFEAVFTNAALHWMLDFEAVIAGVYRALKPGGRFIGEFGGAGNIQTIVAAIAQTFTLYPELGEFNNPWYFPTPEQYTHALTAGGFQVEYIELIPRPTTLKAGLKAWLKLFTDQAIATFTLEQEQLFLETVTAQAQAKLYDEHKGWTADYVRLRFAATKPADSNCA